MKAEMMCQHTQTPRGGSTHRKLTLELRSQSLGWWEAVDLSTVLGTVVKVSEGLSENDPEDMAAQCEITPETSGQKKASGAGRAGGS